MKLGSPRSALLLGAKIALSALLFAWLFSRVQWVNVAATLRHASGQWLAGAFAVLLGSNVLGAWQWQRLLRAAEIRIPFWKVCAYYHVGLFFNNFLPANVGGDFARILDATRAGSSRATALSTVLLDRMIGTIALGGVAVVTTLPAIDRFHLAAVYAGVLAFFVLAIVVFQAILHPALLAWIDQRLAGIGLGRFSSTLDELADRLSSFRSRQRMFIELFGIASVVQVMRIAVHVLVARALGLHIALTYFFLFVPLLAVIVSLPISLNGIGVREGAGIVLFGLVGVDRGSAFSLQFTTYLVAVAVSLIGGLVFLVRIPHRRSGAPSLRRSAG